MRMLRFITSIIILFVFAISAWCDEIVCKDGTVLKGTITQTTEDAVTIQTTFGQTITVKWDKIKEIVKGERAAPPPKTDYPPSPPARSAVEPIRITPVPKKSESSIGLGYGTSYGGFGLCAEFKGGTPFAGHVGIGYFPAKSATGEDFVNDIVMGEVGFKVYFKEAQTSFRPYMDVQFGAVGVAANSDWYGREQKTLIGPSLLGGARVVPNPEAMGNRFFFDVAFGVTYFTNNPEWSPFDSDIQATLDLGLGFIF